MAKKTEELIAIPRSEYEYLKQCEEALLRGLEQRIHDAETEMQRLEFDTMIKLATPPGIRQL